MGGGVGINLFRLAWIHHRHLIWRPYVQNGTTERIVVNLPKELRDLLSLRLQPNLDASCVPSDN